MTPVSDRLHETQEQILHMTGQPGCARGTESGPLCLTGLPVWTRTPLKAALHPPTPRGTRALPGRHGSRWGGTRCPGSAGAG